MLYLVVILLVFLGAVVALVVWAVPGAGAALTQSPGPALSAIPAHFNIVVIITIALFIVALIGAIYAVWRTGDDEALGYFAAAVVVFLFTPAYLVISALAVMFWYASPQLTIVLGIGIAALIAWGVISYWNENRPRRKRNLEREFRKRARSEVARRGHTGRGGLTRDPLALYERGASPSQVLKVLQDMLPEGNEWYISTAIYTAASQVLALQQDVEALRNLSVSNETIRMLDEQADQIAKTIFETAERTEFAASRNLPFDRMRQAVDRNTDHMEQVADKVDELRTHLTNATLNGSFSIQLEVQATTTLRNLSEMLRSEAATGSGF